MKSLALSVTVLAAFSISPPALAQQTCAPGSATLPLPVSSWISKSQVVAGADATSAPLLVPGTAVEATLLPTRQVRYAIQPEKPGGSVAYGGILAVAIDKAETYQVNLGSGAWIDLVRDGKSVASTAHAPGPACSGIRKTVQFPLEPGHYVLQISANAEPAIAVMISGVP